MSSPQSNDGEAVVIPFRRKTIAAPRAPESVAALRREYRRLHELHLARTGTLIPGYVEWIDWLRCFFDMREGQPVDCATLRRTVEKMRRREDAAS